MINKVIALLDKNKISYKVFDKDNVIREYKGIKKRYVYVLVNIKNQ